MGEQISVRVEIRKMRFEGENKLRDRERERRQKRGVRGISKGSLLTPVVV